MFPHGLNCIFFSLMSFYLKLRIRQAARCRSFISILQKTIKRNQKITCKQKKDFLSDLIIKYSLNNTHTLSFILKLPSLQDICEGRSPFDNRTIYKFRSHSRFTIPRASPRFLDSQRSCSFMSA